MTLAASPPIDLGEISINSSVYVSMIPTAAQSVIVKYEPEIQVSCVIPPKDYVVAYAEKKSREKAKKTVIVKSPTLIMSCGYGDVPTPETYKQVAHGYGLFAYDTSRQHKIYAKPYVLANVWDRGQICFGNLTPGSLRQAFNYYWASGFNTDLLKTSHVCNNKRHRNYDHYGCVCQEKRNHSCACLKDVSHKHYGCGCTTVAMSKKCKGTCGGEWDSASSHANCSCCVAINKVIKNALIKDPKLGKRKLSLLAKQLEAGESSYPGCDCSFRHKKTCACRARYYDPKCSCPCVCDCCLKKCNHPICTCRCCKKDCSCPCICSSAQKLALHLESYNITITNERWQDYTSTFCGTKYWAAPTSADGVLVCNNKNLLAKIPRQYWRKDKNGQPLIICLAKKIGTNWKFESGGYSFSLQEKYVITK